MHAISSLNTPKRPDHEPRISQTDEPNFIQTHQILTSRPRRRNIHIKPLLHPSNPPNNTPRHLQDGPLPTKPMLPPKMPQKLLQPLKPLHRPSLSTTKNTPKRTRASPRAGQPLTFHMTLRQKRPAVFNPRGGMCEQLRIELGGATVRSGREGHFEVAGCAAPFPLCAVETCGLGVGFEAV